MIIGGVLGTYLKIVLIQGKKYKPFSIPKLVSILSHLIDKGGGEKFEPFTYPENTKVSGPIDLGIVPRAISYPESRTACLAIIEFR